MGTSIAPGSPCPCVGSRRGVSYKNAACVQTARITLCVQPGGQVADPTPRSAPVLGGFPAQAVLGIAVCFGDSAPDQAALSADSAGTAPILSCRAPMPRLAPTAWGKITA